MELNQYQFYSKNSAKTDNRTELFLEKLKLLKSFKTEKEVRSFLRENWGIKDDIENFNICSDIKLSAGVGKKYYNLTFEHTDGENINIKSFNYIKDERSTTW